MMKWIFLFHLLCSNGQKTDAYTDIAGFQMAKDFINGATLINSFYDVVTESCIDWDKYPASECKLLNIEEMLVNEADFPSNAEFLVWKQ
jgi:hypothetical protein